MLVILDRDGVINEDSDQFIKKPVEWIPIAGSLEAISRLNQSGHRVAVATNQSGLGRGLFTEDDLAAIHQKFYSELQRVNGFIDLLVYCPHHPDDGCDCRKPKAGLFHQIAEELGVPTKGAWVVGDSLRDLQAGVTAGALPILVRTGKGEQTLAKGGLPDETQTVDDLAAAVDYILSQPEI